MTEQDRLLAEKWMDAYRTFYDTQPEDSFSRRLGPEIEELDMAARTVRVRFRPGNWTLNPMGTVHGGIIASMADTAAGILSKALIGAWQGSPTVSMTVNYLRPVLPDTTVIVRAVCRKSGRFLNYTSCEAFSPDRPEEILFTGQCVYFAALEPQTPRL